MPPPGGANVMWLVAWAQDTSLADGWRGSGGDRQGRENELVVRRDPAHSRSPALSAVGGLDRCSAAPQL